LTAFNRAEYTSISPRPSDTVVRTTNSGVLSGVSSTLDTSSSGGPCVKAIISDIHSNLEALQAGLADIQNHPVSETYCLGDVVGYGPNPRECVDLVMKCKMVLLGNHDQGAMFDPEGFNPPAERAIFWTREQLENAADDRQLCERRWEFLADRPRSFR